VIACVFPGQGSQKVGMGKALADAFSVCRESFAEADAALGEPLSRLCFEGPDEQLTLTDRTSATHAITIHGPDALDTAARAIEKQGADASQVRAMEPFAYVSVTIGASPVVAYTASWQDRTPNECCRHCARRARRARPGAPIT